MTGRFENDRKIEKKADAKVAKMPEYVGKWYLNLKASRKTPMTCNDYVNKINKFLSSINEDVSSVTLDSINESSVTKYFLSTQTKRASTGQIVYTSDSYQDTVWCCLDSFLGYLYESKLIDQNYIRRINKPKNHDLDRINENRRLLTGDDFNAILNAVKDVKNDAIRTRDYAILLVFMNTGMRETALTEIMTEDYDYVNRTLTIIDKGKKRHTYNLNEMTHFAILEWLMSHEPSIDGHLFLTIHGDKMHVNTVAYLVEKYSKQALGYAISPHKLRAGYCSILYNKTHDIEFVRRAVGHSNVSTTQRYIVTGGEEKQRAADIMGDVLG